MTRPRKKAEEFRSHRWFGVEDLRSFGHRSRIKQIGYSPADYAGKPVIAIINTWSDINHCHTHFRQRAEEVKRGIWQAGGFPLEMPAMALAETMQKPTTMMYRNFLAMETEELLRSYPADGAVLMGGCDKTTPALLMGAISMNLPAIRARQVLPHGDTLIGVGFANYIEMTAHGTALFSAANLLSAAGMMVPKYFLTRSGCSRYAVRRASRPWLAVNTSYFSSRK